MDENDSSILLKKTSEFIPTVEVYMRNVQIKMHLY